MDQYQNEECYVQEVQLENLVVNPNEAFGTFTFTDEVLTIPTSGGNAVTKDGNVLKSSVKKKLSKLHFEGEVYVGEVEKTFYGLVMKTKMGFIEIDRNTDKFLLIESPETLTIQNPSKEPAECKFKLDVDFTIKTVVHENKVTQQLILTNNSTIDILSVEELNVLFALNNEVEFSETKTITLDGLKEIKAGETLQVPFYQEEAKFQEITMISINRRHNPRRQQIFEVKTKLCRSEAEWISKNCTASVKNGDTLIAFDQGIDERIIYDEFREKYYNSSSEAISVRIAETDQQLTLLFNETI